MKILIGLIVLAAIYFIYKKMSGGKDTTQASGESTPSASPAPTPAVEDTGTQPEPNASSTEPSAAAETAATPVAATSTTAETSKTPALEHLFGIDRRTGKALRALGITDLNALLNAGTDKLEAAGFDAAAAKILKAQAALAALPGVTPQEASVLANSGIDSISTLAEQNPAELLDKVARANRNVGALKTPPGVQQLQRLISSAKEAA